MVLRPGRPGLAGGSTSFEIRLKGQILELPGWKWFEACEPGKSGVCCSYDKVQAAPVPTECGPCRLEPGAAAKRESCAGRRGESASCAIYCARAGCVQSDGFCACKSTGSADSDTSCPSEATGPHCAPSGTSCPSEPTGPHCAPSGTSCPSEPTGPDCVQPDGFCACGSTGSADSDTSCACGSTGSADSATACACGSTGTDGADSDTSCACGSTGTDCVQTDGFCAYGSTGTDLCRHTPGTRDVRTRGRGAPRA